MIRRQTAGLFVGIWLALTTMAASAETVVTSWGHKPDPQGSAYLASPTTLATDGRGTLLVTDLGNSRILAVRDLDGSAAPQVLGGLGELGSDLGQLNLPFGVAVDKDGNLLVADSANHRIQKLDRRGFKLSEWGSRGTGPGQFELPREIAVDSQNRYFITDEFNSRVQVFDRNGSFLFQIGGFGTGPGQFRLPQGIAIDGNDRLFVADTFNHRIQVFDASGTFLTQIGTTGATGDGPTTFYYPRGVAVDEHGGLFVADTFNHKIKKYSAALEYQYSVGAFPQPTYPNSIRPMGNGSFYVSDTGNSQVLRYRDNGTGAQLTAVVGTARVADGQFNNPGSIAVGPDNRVYVVDKFNHRIQVFSADGQFLQKWGKNAGAGGMLAMGTAPGEFYMPGQASFDAQGRLFVADMFNSRVQVFAADGQYLTSIGGFGLSPGTFYLPSGVDVDADGNVFVVDWATGWIQKFDSDFQFVGYWGGLGLEDGKFRRPTEVALDAAGNVYVVDSLNSRVQKFDNDGTFLGKWGTDGGNPHPDQLLSWGKNDGGMFLPQGIRIGNGTVYVTDTSNNRVQKFDLDGHFLGKWGSFGGRVTEFFNPTGIDVDGAGNVYTVDILLHRVQKFSP